MAQRGRAITILIADDDAEDRTMMEEAFAESHLANPLRFVEDGEELMDYLYRRGLYSEPASAPRPGLILLDLNMPKKDGRKALQEIKGDRTLRQIPVIILTTSKAEQDIYRSYDLGVNSFITKPVTFTALMETVKTFGKYWFDIVELPPDHTRK
ncbi:MAG: response regulator [Deltaproteobacteria bacterium]|nr:response regulator [Deltaproteobacteria bacterium]